MGITRNEDIRETWKDENPYDNGCCENIKAFCCHDSGPSIGELENDNSISNIV